MNNEKNKGIVLPTLTCREQYAGSGLSEKKIDEILEYFSKTSEMVRFSRCAYNAPEELSQPQIRDINNAKDQLLRLANSDLEIIVDPPMYGLLPRGEKACQLQYRENYYVGAKAIKEFVDDYLSGKRGEELPIGIGFRGQLPALK